MRSSDDLCSESSCKSPVKGQVSLLNQVDYSVYGIFMHFYDKNTKLLKKNSNIKNSEDLSSESSYNTL